MALAVSTALHDEDHEDHENDETEELEAGRGR